MGIAPSTCNRFFKLAMAWVDEKGLLNFRDDIYKRDASIAKKMFAGG